MEQENRVGIAFGHMRMAIRSLRGKGVPSPMAVAMPAIVETDSEMPQAVTRESRNVDRALGGNGHINGHHSAADELRNLMVAERDWRTHFASQLLGEGLEIGPLHRPMVKHEGMNVTYIDRYTVAQLRAHYPELNELPLVEADIIGDAQSLEGVGDAKYDFLTAAHVIEHMRDPIRALTHWCRVVKPGGYIYLIAPDKRATFDRKRVRTTLEHIILDFLAGSGERDYEHFLDWAIHCNHKSGIEAIEEADRLVAEDYSIHFHVFMPSDITRLVNWVSENVRPITIVEGPAMSPGSDEFHFLLRVEPLEPMN